MPMTPASYPAFWEGVCQAVPEWLGLIHYNTPQVHNVQRGADYAVLQAEIPNLIGTKHVGADVPGFLSLVADSPQLSHFTGEHCCTPFAFFGARGVSSWFANVNAPYMVAWYGDLTNRRWEAARHRQERMHAFMRTSEMLHQDCSLHAIIGKALTAASSFLVPANRTRRPYLPVPDDLVARFRRIAEHEFPDLCWRG
jgi:dihydrodipicolinate synthase/N-acetylneuraminate lyase